MRLADIIHYNAAIGACDKAGDWQSALRYLKEAKVNGLQPDIIAYFTTLRACGSCQKWQEALQLLVKMIGSVNREGQLLLAMVVQVVPSGSS